MTSKKKPVVRMFTEEEYHAGIAVARQSATDEARLEMERERDRALLNQFIVGIEAAKGLPPTLVLVAVFMDLDRKEHRIQFPLGDLRLAVAAIRRLQQGRA